MHIEVLRPSWAVLNALLVPMTERARRLVPPGAKYAIVNAIGPTFIHLIFRDHERKWLKGHNLELGWLDHAPEWSPDDWGPVQYPTMWERLLVFEDESPKTHLSAWDHLLENVYRKERMP